MSFIGSMFSSGQGAGYQAQGANLQQAVNSDQTNQAYQNSEQGLSQQQAFLNALSAQNGISNQSNVYNQQQALANQLQLQTQGGGPNPAAAQLAQATQANTANQAALMASQRGTSANAGLIARQAAQQGAANQQNAIGQTATLRAQQQLAAQQQLQQQQSNLGGLATQQVGQQQGGLNAYNQYAQGEQQNLLNAVAQYNNAQVGMQSNINQANAQIAGINTQGQQKLLGGLLNGAGVNAQAHGGMIDSYAQGGTVMPMQPNNPNAPVSTVGNILNGYSQGGNVRNMVGGGKVDGKAQIKGDSYANDTKPAILSPGEIVIPRHITMGENPEQKAAEFVRQTLAKKKNEMTQQFAEGGQAQEDDDNSDNQQQPNQPVINIINSPDKQGQQQTEQQQGETPEPVTVNPNLVDQIKNNQGTPPQNPPQQPQGPQNVDLNIKPQGQGQPTPILNQLPGREIYEKPTEEQAQSIAREAAAKGALGQQQAKAYGQNAQNLQDLQNQYQQRQTDLMGKIDAATQDFSNGHINPNHYMENMSTAGKISSAIGLILGGIGGGLTGQGNPAAQFLQNQIDRDIDSQKANLGKKETLLSSYFKEFGNMQDATAMTKATQMSILASQIEKAGAQSQNPIERERATQQANQLRLQIAPMVSEAGIRQTLLSQGNQQQGNSDLDAFKARYLAPKGKEEQTEKDLKEFQDLRSAKANALRAFDEANSENTLANRTLSPIQTQKRVESALAPVIAETAKFAVGKFTEADNSAIKNTFNTQWANPETVAKQRRDLAAIYDNKMNYPSLKGVGINTNTPNATKGVTPPTFLAKR
jgi:hypothetical protein